MTHLRTITILLLMSNSLGAAEFVPPDCGVNSLYLLLDLNGKRTSISHIKSLLPPARDNGYSLDDLRRAAKPCGLRLTGKILRLKETPLDRAVLAHLDTGVIAGGHYVVLVPAGTTGKVVQLIDYPYAPKMLDYSSIVSDDSGIPILYQASISELVLAWLWLLPVTVSAVIICVHLLRRDARQNSCKPERKTAVG